MGQTQASETEAGLCYGDLYCAICKSHPRLQLHRETTRWQWHTVEHSETHIKLAWKRVCVFYLTAHPGIILQRERTFSNGIKQKKGIILPQFHKHNTAYCLCKIQVNISDFTYGGSVHSSTLTSIIRPR